MNKINVIIAGATGMIGEAVLHECIEHPAIEKILVITRNSSGRSHPKLREILHNDFGDISALKDRLEGYDACYFCTGTTVLGKTEEEYTRLTYTLTLNFASTLASINPNLSFCYISGAGTDSTEKGRSMWARVKGKTENDLMKLPFKKVYNFRPGGLIPFLPLKPSQTYYKTYKYFGWMFSLVAVFAPNIVSPLKDFAAAMINSTIYGYSKSILEVNDIKALAKMQ